jgi:hypothetical protein
VAKVALATPDCLSGVAEATPNPNGGGSAAPKGQTIYLFLDLALGGGLTTPKGHGVASATLVGRSGVAEATPGPTGVVWPPPRAKQFFIIIIYYYFFFRSGPWGWPDNPLGPWGGFGHPQPRLGWSGHPIRVASYPLFF